MKTLNDIDIEFKQTVQNQFKRNPNRSLSACFRSVTNQNRFFGKGDYPFLADILTAISKIGITHSKQQVLYAFNQSSELSGLSKGIKSELLKQLLELSSVVIETPENALGQTKNKKEAHTSSEKGNW